MIREDILVIGIGQGGCLLAQQIDSLAKYNVFYCNSAQGDLDGLEAQASQKIHFKKQTGEKGKGSGSDRNNGLMYAMANMDAIFNKIETEYIGAKYIFVAFSAGGGTGSGASPYVIQELTKRYNPQEQMDQDFKRRYVGAIPIFTGSDDGVGRKGYENAIACLRDLNTLYENGSVCNIIPLDNDRMHRWMINEEFTNDFDKYLSVDQNTGAGFATIDGADSEHMLESKGVVRFATFKAIEKPDKTPLAKISVKKYMPEFEKETEMRNEYIAVNYSPSAFMNHELFSPHVKSYFGTPREQMFSGYSNVVCEDDVEVENQIFVTGMPMPSHILNGLNKMLQQEVDRLIEENKKVTPSLNFNSVDTSVLLSKLTPSQSNSGLNNSIGLQPSTQTQAPRKKPLSPTELLKQKQLKAKGK